MPPIEPTKPDAKPEPKNVIERVREQLEREGKVRGRRVPRYRTKPDGTEERIADALDHVSMQSSEVLELCALAAGNGKADDITKALEKGHRMAAQTPKARGVNYADDIFHLLDAAGTSRAEKADKVKPLEKVL